MPEKEKEKKEENYVFVYSHFPAFSDRFQVSSGLLAETEEVRQSISKLSKEVQ